MGTSDLWISTSSSHLLLSGMHHTQGEGRDPIPSAGEDGSFTGPKSLAYDSAEDLGAVKSQSKGLGLLDATEVADVNKSHDQI